MKTPMFPKRQPIKVPMTFLPDNYSVWFDQDSVLRIKRFELHLGASTIDRYIDMNDAATAAWIHWSEHAVK